MAEGKARIRLMIYDGSRQAFSEKHDVLLRVHNGQTTDRAERTFATALCELDRKLVAHPRHSRSRLTTGGGTPRRRIRGSPARQPLCSDFRTEFKCPLTSFFRG